MIERKMCTSVAASRYYLNYAFSELPLRDKSVLDIGCGAGITTAYAACQGAKTVVGLEPEMKGSVAGCLDQAREIVRTLDIGRGHIQMLPQTIQGYDSHGVRFDLVLMHNSINHLDEEACQKLHVCQTARETYTRFFS
jgi:2-polyprenyl-3-methyl-5-hydroxy-6-metoxy-1,4-benzoquinol methylase